MKQLLQNLRSGEIIIEDVPVPSPGRGMVLIKTSASLISAGTERMLVSFAEKSLVGKARSRPDLVRQTIDKLKTDGVISTVKAVNRRIDQPLALGYSSAGVVVELGADVQKFKIGQRVACAGGGYAVHAEFAVVPENLLAALPNEVDAQSAAFTTLASIGLHGFRLSESQIGDNVAIIGLGLLGLLTAMIAKSAGCQVFGIDLDPKRVELAQEIGVQSVLPDAAEDVARTFSGGRGFDAVLICADTKSNDPINLAADIARDRAKVISLGAVGLDMPRTKYFQKELTFLVSRSYGPGRYDPTYEEEGVDYPIGYVRWTEGRNLEAVVAMMAAGQLIPEKLITHRFNIDEAQQAYQLVTGKSKQPFLGIVLTYADDSDDDINAHKSVSFHSGSKRNLKTEQINLGIIGAGNFANATMLPILARLSGVNLVGIASKTGLNAQQAAKKHKINYATSDFQALIDDPKINTIAIFTRHDSHAELIVAALQAGKHVFCEKPLAINEAQLNDIATIIDQHSSPLLMLGYNRRFAPLAVKMKSFFDPCSEPMVVDYRVNAGYLPPEHWLHNPVEGGGRIIGEACHFVDFVSFMIGQTPNSVFCTGMTENTRYHEDNVVMTFSFPNGSVGTVTYLANGDSSIPKEQIGIYCQGRVAQLNNFRKLTLTKDGRSKSTKQKGQLNKGHKEEWQVFVNSISKLSYPPIAYADLLTISRATFAAVKSLRNEIVVKFE